MTRAAARASACAEPPFVVTDPATWIARGRTVQHADALARAWRDFPDLPPCSPLDARLARTRERVAALRPVHEAIQAQTERDRQAANFRFVRARCADGGGDARDEAILRGASEHGQGWDAAVRFADGWHAARSGWPYRPPTPSDSASRAAYDQGFADGGGDPSDLFDAARRAARIAPSLPAAFVPSPARPLPSSWPKPTDEPRPVRWERRLLLLGDGDLAAPPATRGRARRLPSALELARAPDGAAAMAVIVLGADAGFSTVDACRAPGQPLTAERADRIIGDPAQRHRLRELLQGREFDDVLVTVQGDYLRIVDALAGELPLCRAMERTRNTPLQQRLHLATWLARGITPGTSVGAGHIRWDKVAKGLAGRLGEFVARYAGAPAGGGHLISITLGGKPATGFVTADGRPLANAVRISSKARLRPAMAEALRAFGGATRLGAPGRGQPSADLAVPQRRASAAAGRLPARFRAS